MKKKQELRRICAYAAGVAVLAAAVAAAWFMPEWFGLWQDEKLLNEVTLETRDNIDFLDVDSLDRTGRLQALERTQYLGWETGGYIAGFTEEQKERCTGAVQQWIRCGLLPEECADWVSTEYPFVIDSVTLYLDDGVFQADLFMFYQSSEEDDSFWKSDLTVLIDRETGMIYYAAFSGDAFLEYLAGACGFDSWEELEKYGEKMDYQVYWEELEDITPLDFAAPCGGESAQVERIASYAPEEIQDYRGALRATIQFETFEGHAYRREVSTSTGPGLAVMYGPEEKWMQTIQEILGNYGFMIDFGTSEYAESKSETVIK